MLRVLSRALMWLGSRRMPGWMENADKFHAQLEHPSTNSDALFLADADPERLRRLSELSDADPAEAFAQFLTLAENGSAWSMLRVGYAYELGQGAPRNLALAQEWYLRASERGSDQGLLQAGYFAFSSGDFVRARAIYGVGVTRGLTPAMHYLAGMELKLAKTEEARDRARALFEQATALGDLSAEISFARAMAHGKFGLRLIPAGMRRICALARVISMQIDAMTSPSSAK